MNTIRVYFIDVGQGDCSLIVLPDKTGVLVDCRDPLAATELMRRVGVEHLRAIVATHLDWDHAGGIHTLIKGYCDAMAGGTTDRQLRQLDALWVTYDRSRGQLTRTGYDLLALAVSQAEAAGVALAAPTRDRVPLVDPANRLIWPLQADAEDWAVELLLPFHGSRLEQYVEVRNEPNHVSAVVRVRHGEHRLIIGGDAPLVSFEQLDAAAPDELCANVIRSPHHGGDIRVGHQLWREFSDLYDRVNAELGVFSVGTNNGEGHPRPDHVRASTRAGACHVMCTQLTSQCHDDVDEERLRTSSVSADVTYPTHRRARRGAKRTRATGTPCAGTVMVVLDGASMEIFPALAEHREVLHILDHPLCMTRSS